MMKHWKKMHGHDKFEEAEHMEQDEREQEDKEYKE